MPSKTSKKKAAVELLVLVKAFRDRPRLTAKPYPIRLCRRITTKKKGRLTRPFFYPASLCTA